MQVRNGIEITHKRGSVYPPFGGWVLISIKLRLNYFENLISCILRFPVQIRGTRGVIFELL
jgi:hypothetical protein